MNEEVFLNPKTYKLNEFKFKSGEILKDLPVEYMTLGNPKYDENNKITNAIVYCHGSSGDFGSIRRIEDLISKGALLDYNDYFLISLSGLGSSNSASPSSTNLKSNFPSYNVEDMVEFQIAFLNEKFNINHLKGIIGNSMGGFVALTWAAKYPNFSDFIISLVSSYKVAGHNYAASKFMNDIILSDPEYNKGNYDKSLTNTLKLATKSMFALGLSREYFRSLTNEEINVEMENLGIEGSFDDANDVIFKNNACHSYNIENELKNIKSPVLIIAINQDQYFPPELDAIPMSKMIKNSKLVCYDSLLGHIGSKEILKVEDEIKEFLGMYLK